MEDSLRLIEECKIIENDCLYTAEAHFIIADKEEKISLLVKVIPAIASAISGSALLCGAPNWIAWFSVISGVAFALQSIMNPDKKCEEHTRAGNLYTVLKHDSRSLYQTFYNEMDRSCFVSVVKLIRERYNMISLLSPKTSKSAFEEGRERIKSGRHLPDFKEQRAREEME